MGPRKSSAIYESVSDFHFHSIWILAVGTDIIEFFRNRAHGTVTLQA